MTKQRPTNIAASVRQKLLNLARARQEDFSLILNQYAIERFLHRLSQSRHRDDFVLKGATLFSVWGGGLHRPTRDVDLLGRGSIDEIRLQTLFADVVQEPVEPDGLDFDDRRIQANRIKEEDEYRGIRVEIHGKLGSARVHLQVDVGFGDVVVPEAIETELPVLLDHQPPRLKIYPKETVIAEKFQAMVDLGIVNSRMKDYFDLWYLSTHFTFDGPLLSEAIQKTFAKRKTDLPPSVPIGISETFANDPAKQTQWRAFLKKGRLTEAPDDLKEVVQRVKSFLWPLVQSAQKGDPYNQTWISSQGWQEH